MYVPYSDYHYVAPKPQLKFMCCPKDPSSKFLISLSDRTIHSMIQNAGLMMLPFSMHN